MLYNSCENYNKVIILLLIGDGFEISSTLCGLKILITYINQVLIAIAQFIDVNIVYHKDFFKKMFNYIKKCKICIRNLKHQIKNCLKK